MPVSSPQKRQEWEEKIRLQKESGFTVKAWCLQNAVAYHCFKYWRSILKPAPALTRSSFKELSDSTSSSGIIIEKKGLRIHIAKNFDEKTLSQFLRALDKLC